MYFAAFSYIMKMDNFLTGNEASGELFCRGEAGMDQREQTRPLDRYLSPLDVWGMAFGCMVGWGVFAMPGTTFLPVAGPAGTAIAMLIGMAITLLIGLPSFLYAIIRRLPALVTFQKGSHIPAMQLGISGLIDAACLPRPLLLMTGFMLRVR